MILKVFDTEIKLEGPPYKFDPEICELSLLCEDIKGRIWSFNEIENDIKKFNYEYYLLFDSENFSKSYGKTIEDLK
jgi:hypothetical protein